MPSTRSDKELGKYHAAAYAKVGRELGWKALDRDGIPLEGRKTLMDR